ncbi:MAG TPA: hypothetical protein VM141_13750 [Planctomycetota bacterium]|nr:hypothetical protein [Planctomycetota bacterium]
MLSRFQTPILALGGRHYRFAEAWPAWWLAAAALILLAFLVYRHETGTTMPRHRIFLGIIRCIALFILLAMIFRPVLVSEQSHTKDCALIVLIDRSLSMEIRDEYRDKAYEAAVAVAAGIAPEGTVALSTDQKAQLALLNRSQLVARILDHTSPKLLKELREKCTPRLYTFASNAGPQQWPADGRKFEPLLKPEGRTTAIGDCIREAVRELKGQRIAGMVIITDGQSNTGRDPVAAAEEYALNREEPFPIYTVGVGDPSEPKDVEVLQIFGNSTVFAKDSILFTVSVNSHGFAGRQAFLTIKSGDSIIVREAVELKDMPLQQVPVRFKIDTPGEYECRAVIDPLPDELTAKNNESPPHLLEVIDRSVKVLLVSELPTWEYRYLKNYLIRDTSVKVSCLQQSADSEFFQEGTLPVSEFPKTREELFAYDVVILLGVNPARFTEVDLLNLQSFVEEIGGGLIVAAQEHYPPSMFNNTPIEKLLPVTPGPPRSYNPLREQPLITQSFTPELTPAGGQHPVMSLAANEQENQRTWQNLPGMFWYYQAQKLKPGAVALLEHPTDRNEHSRYPLVAVQFYRRGRTMFLGIDSTWRWRYLKGDHHFGQFWGQAIRFLSSSRLLGENKRLNVATDKNTYVLGQKVVVQARSLDRFYEPSKADELAAKVASPDFSEMQVTLKAVPRSPGMFRGEFTPPQPGKFSVTVRSGSGSSAAESTASLVVRMPDFEYDRPGMDVPGLRRIAKVTGGNYLSLPQLAGISNELEKLREEYISEEQRDVWDTPWLLVIFATLVVVEWSVRKRKMLA